MLIQQNELEIICHEKELNQKLLALEEAIQAAKDRPPQDMDVSADILEDFRYGRVDRSSISYIYIYI